MPDFTLRAPENSNWPGENFVVSDRGERARLLAAGYTDVTDQTAAEPVEPANGGQTQPKQDSEKPSGKAAPKPAPGTETRQPSAG